jgi:O-antigen/teichoic acid export membrane protein
MEANSPHPISDLRIRRAAHTVLVTQTFNLVGTLLSLVAVPLYLTWLGREGYGLLLSGLAFAGYLGFADVGMSWSSIILIAHASGKDDHAGIASIVRNSLSLALVSVFVVACVSGTLVFALAHGVNVPFMPRDEDFPLLLAVVAGSVCSSLIASSIYGLYNGMQHGYTAGLFQGVGRIAGTCASLAAAWMGARVSMVLLANVVVACVFHVLAAAAAWYLYPWAFARGRMWERNQIRLQLRTGLKNFGLQIGDVIASTAPILAISSQLGTAAVPQFTVPLTMLKIPLGLFFSINAALQSGYGEAYGRGDTPWISHTVRIVMENALILITLLSLGYFFVGSEFVTLWTQGRLPIGQLQLLGAWLMAVTMSLLGIYRFVLAGVNHQKLAAISEMIFGFLSLLFAVVAVRHTGVVGAGVGVLLAALLTSAWVLPMQLRVVLPDAKVFPNREFLARLFAVTFSTLAAGAILHSILHSASPALAILIQSAGISAVFVLSASWLLPEAFGRVRLMVLSSLKLRPRMTLRRSADVE